MSVAIENLKSHFETYVEYDPMMSQPQPSNPWISEDQTFWQLNSSLSVISFFICNLSKLSFCCIKNLKFLFCRVEVPTEKRVKRWALSMEELMSDPTGK